MELRAKRPGPSQPGLSAGLQGPYGKLAMSAILSPDELVQLCVVRSDGGLASAETWFSARVDSVMQPNRCRLSLLSGERLEPPSGALVIRKRTPWGLIEIDGVVLSILRENPILLTVELAAATRGMQRREDRRVEMVADARFRNLSLAHEGEPELWHGAQLNDLSLGGASLQLQGEMLLVGHRLAVEFTLGERFFQIPAIVRRIEPRGDGKPGGCSLQFEGIDRRQQDHLGRALAREELKLLGRRVRI